jgi:hypothetical protein
MMTAGSCIIPFIRGLAQRLIETSLTKETSISHQNSFFVLDTTEYELMITEFKEKNADE